MGEDLDDGFVAETHRAQVGDVGFGNVRTVLDHLQRKGQRGRGLRVVAAAGLGFAHLVGAGAGLLAQHGVRGQAVVAGVAVGDGDGDLLAELGRQYAAAQGAEAAPQRSERGRRVGHGAEHVRGGAERALDLGQQRLAGGGGAAAVEQCDSGHGDLLFDEGMAWPGCLHCDHDAILGDHPV